jgi:hypothetical protein
VHAAGGLQVTVNLIVFADTTNHARKLLTLTNMLPAAVAGARIRMPSSNTRVARQPSSLRSQDALPDVRAAL